MTSLSKKTPNVVFQCKYCRRAFPNSVNLVNHKLLEHAGDVLQILHESNVLTESTEVLEIEDGVQATPLGSLNIMRFSQVSLNGKATDLQSKQEPRKIPMVGRSPNSQFSCQFCGKNFKSNRDVIRHERIHTGEKPHVCEVCSKAFADPSSWKKHQMDCKAKSTPPIPPATSSDAANMDEPRIEAKNGSSGSETGDSVESEKFEEIAEETAYAASSPALSSPALSKTCRFCSKICRSLTDLAVHERSHTREKPHICKFCSKGFAHMGSVKVHMRRCRRRYRKSTSPMSSATTLLGPYDFNKLEVADLPESTPAADLPEGTSDLQVGASSAVIETNASGLIQSEFQPSPNLSTSLTAMPSQVESWVEVARRFSEKTSVCQWVVPTQENSHMGEGPFSCKECGIEFLRFSDFNLHRKDCLDPPQLMRADLPPLSDLDSLSILEAQGPPQLMPMELRTRSDPQNQAVAESLQLPGDFEFHSDRPSVSTAELRGPQKQSRTPMAKSKFQFCLTCSKKCSSPKNLAIHMNIHTGKKPYSCRRCSSKFNNPGTLSRHKISCRGKRAKSVPPQEQPMEVHEETIPEFHKGNTTVDTEKIASEFMPSVEHNAVQSVPVLESASNDGGEFEQENNQEGHGRIQVPLQSVEPTSFVGGTNDEAVITTSSNDSIRYLSHIMSHIYDGGQLSYSCNHCGNINLTKTEATKHAVMHVGPNMYHCPHCNETFPEEAFAIDHEQRIHSEELKALVDGEANGVVQPKGRRKHDYAEVDIYIAELKSEGGARVFVCNFCDKIFMRKTSARDHIMCHTGTKRHQCEECGSSYNRLAELRSHMASVHTANKLDITI